MRLLTLLLLTGCEEITNPSGAPMTSSHPCTGGRTDTLFVDSGGDMYLGCGEASEGLGLYRSTDRGGTWAAVAGFDDFRVSDVSESGGTVYIAGTQPSGMDRVRTLAGDTVFEATMQLWNTFHVGTFVRQADGLAIAESLTGTGMATRPSDSAPWEDAVPWVNGSFQMLDVVDDDGTMVGVGSTISQPHTVFVQDDGANFRAVTVSVGGFTGELWSVHADDGRYVAGGVDQDADQGLIYVNDGDPTLDEDWYATRIPEDATTWVRDVCRMGDTILAVGAFSQTDTGFAYRSTNGGDSFERVDLQDDPPALYNCWLDGSGAYVAGGAGYFARL